ncbi:MAG TPA: prolipoprotein diacylglyceryl transferase [Kiritimatiellia bacterium]|nr:prolipoprotein diacylglyceryl transferase [Kiritimatiellia bacterium]HMO99493.1 prolipoprotein diacylglyceryl transferase [Kiritimatiellia bacterium]HMP97996.1 prolipoprotein diacylglyceryl transferase [Kiritimatiellia bacterium]
MTDTAYYIHQLDPVLLPLWGPLAIRWYGLAYIAGFVGAYFMLNRWGRQGRYPLHGEALQAFMVTVVIGVMIGGRLGYLLFYDTAAFLRDPLLFFRLWEGGMASHGGMIGLAAAAAYAARRQRLSFLALADGLATVAPLGLGLGRLANFINGELWGRITSVRWAVIFPQEAGLYPEMAYTRDTVLMYLERGLLHPRHPSQLYQAFLEGVVLLALLLWAHRSAWGRVEGRMGGLFLGLYAVVRFFAEFFREPEITHFGWMTQGQLLSAMILLPASIYLIARTYQPARSARP